MAAASRTDTGRPAPSPRVINLKAAKALRLNIPGALLARADRVIE